MNGARAPAPGEKDGTMVARPTTVRVVNPSPDGPRHALSEAREQLVQQIRELTPGHDVSLDFDADFADRAQVAAEQDENRSLAGSLQQQLVQIDAALARIEAGTYGLCEVCGDAISEARLEVMPATPRCINHA